MLRKSLIIKFLVLAVALPSAWQFKLEERGRYFLTPWDRFKTDPIEASSGIRCLSYAKVPVNSWAVVNFDLGVAFFYETINGVYVYAPRAIPFDSISYAMQYSHWRKNLRQFHKEKKHKGKLFEIPAELPPNVRAIIGTGGASIGVSGAYRITMSGRSQWTDREEFYGSKWPQLQMEQESNFKITGNIGSKIKVNVDQDSQRETDLENTINIKYTGEEDDVVRSIEAGNTTLSLEGADLVGYSERVQGLFGIKSVFQIGDWNITVIASQEKGNTQKVTIHPTVKREGSHKNDFEYKQRTYFYIADQYVNRIYQPGDSISLFELYISNYQAATNPNSIHGYAFVQQMRNPDELPEDLDEMVTRTDSVVSAYFVKVDESQYRVDRLHGWFRLNTPAMDADIIAARFVINHSDGTADTFGFPLGDTLLILKLIKPSYMQPSHPCWEYEWRNVYELGLTDFDLQTAYIKLFRRVGTDSSQSLPENANVFLLSLYGMDSVDINDQPNPDGLVDQKLIFIDPGRGELIFPVPHPFDPRAIDVMLVPSLVNYPDSLRNPALYNSTDKNEMELNSKMFIYAEVEGLSQHQSLGAYNIIRGSEVVTLNGERLKRGVDYRIDYEYGKIYFLSDKAKVPNANIQITFEAQPYFSIKQKTLLGTRIKYELGEDSWIGFTGLYRSISSPTERPRVGGEPSNAYIVDSDLRLSSEVPFVTKLVNSIPLIDTDVPSRLTLKLEAAKLYSTPNTIGKAYIDDFESSKIRSPISIRRTMWTPSSAPYGYAHQPRALLRWYNPYHRVPKRDIWPNIETTAHESNVDVLTIEFHDTTTVPGDSMPWAGIMQYIPQAFQEQRDAQFLEIWVQGDKGVLTIDIGCISEDIDGDGELDTEDKKINGRYDNILTKDEDTGLDGMFDDQELDYYLTTAGVDITGMSVEQKKSKFRELFPDLDPDDPSGDNWDYSTDDPENYTHINGTEGNSSDPAYGGRPKPDTEDIDRNGVLDTRNAYFSYRIDLSSKHFEVPGTRNEATGWRLYRIPLRDSLFRFVEDGKVWRRIKVGDPDPSFATIKYIRLWLTNVEGGEAKVSIASIDFVHNQWREDFDNFEVAVKNSQEDLDYNPPPGVSGERDPQTGLTLAERSLALIYEYLPPHDTVYAYKVIPTQQAEDYTRYKRLTMWVHFDSAKADGAAPQLLFRIGSSTNDYYEYITFPLHDGWDSVYNRVVIDFDELTNFKEQYLRAKSDTAIPDIPNIKLASHGHGYYVIHGNPTLTNVTQLQIGLINPDPNFPISGEVWCDELVVEDVRVDDGAAYKAELTLQAADFARFSATYDQRDDDFHELTSISPRTTYYGGRYRFTRGRGLPEHSFRKTWQYNVGFTLGKFFPPRWNVSLPLSMSWSFTTALPRYKTGSDVVLSDSARQLEKTTQRSTNISLAGVGAAPENRTKLIDLLVVPNRLTYTYTTSQQHSPSTPFSTNTSYSIIHTYSLNPRGKVGYGYRKFGTTEKDTTSKSGNRLLSVLKGLFIPTSINLNTTVEEQSNRSQDRYGTRNNVFRRNLKHDTKLGFAFAKDLTGDFNIHLERDIHDPNFLVIGLPTIVGRPVSKSINWGLHWTPRYLEFLSQRYDINSKYNENTHSPTPGTFGNVSQTRTLKAGYTIMWNKFFNKAKKDEKMKRSIANLLSKLDNLKIDLNWTANISAPNLRSRPIKLFQLGLTGDPGVPFVSDVATRQQPKVDNTQRVDANTGAKLPQDVRISISYHFTRQSVQSTSNNTKTISHTLPELTARWGFFNKLKFFKLFARSVSARSNWVRKVTTGYTNDQFSNRKVESRLSPLLGMNFTLKGGWSVDLKFNWETSLSENFNGVTIGYSRQSNKSLDVIARYTLRAQKGIKIPLLGSITLENNLNITINTTYSVNIIESWNSANPVKTKTQDRARLTIRPQLSYNLSRNATAGMEIEITEDTDRRFEHITTHIRDVRIWVLFNFGGSRGISPGGFFRR